MFLSLRILVSGFTRTGQRVRRATIGAIASTTLTAALCACGQQGPLYLPTDPAAANRATLPQTLLPKLAPNTTADAAAASPAKPASR